MTEANKTIESCTSVERIRRGNPWLLIDDNQEIFTLVVASLGREYRDWATGEGEEAVKQLIRHISSEYDTIVFYRRNYQEGQKSGWAFTVRVNGETIAEGSVQLTSLHPVC